MFTATLYREIDNDGSHCGKCQYLRENDGGDHRNYWSCNIFDVVLDDVWSDQKSWHPLYINRCEECIIAEFESAIETSLKE